jgi:hypothetical protein
VPDSASAVVLNVTGVRATQATDLSVTPATAGAAVPETTNVSMGAGTVVPNLVIVKVGDGGRVRLRNRAGNVAVLVDLSGWYDRTAPGGVLFRPVPPSRLFDTRTEADPARRRLAAGGTGSWAVTGAAGVPAGATAVLLNVTAVAASAGTDVRVYPRTASSEVPVVSNLNLTAGQTNANAVVVGVGAGGAVSLRNSNGTVALLSDVAGWFGP